MFQMHFCVFQLNNETFHFDLIYVSYKVGPKWSVC